MKIVTAFYAGLILHEYDPGDDGPGHRGDWPDGTYFYNSHQRAWYLHRWGNSAGINLNEVPKELRAIVLLLS